MTAYKPHPNPRREFTIHPDHPLLVGPGPCVDSLQLRTGHPALTALLLEPEPGDRCASELRRVSLNSLDAVYRDELLSLAIEFETAHNQFEKGERTLAAIQWALGGKQGINAHMSYDRELGPKLVLFQDGALDPLEEVQVSTRQIMTKADQEAIAAAVGIPAPNLFN